MVKFVAKRGVNLESLDELDALDDPSTSKREPDSFTVKDGNVKLEIEGSGFGYVLGVPFKGRISDIDVKISGDLAYSLSKMKLKITDLLPFSSAEKAVKEILDGDDKLIGSNEKDTLLGFKGDDTIKGKKGKDTLDGGKGDDELNGGKGKDTYEFTSKPSKGVDTITNFEAGETIALENKVFDVGSNGALDEDLFHAGSNATDADQRIIYRENKGKIYYDSDGDGGADKKLFAKVDKGTSLDADDFMVI